MAMNFGFAPLDFQISMGTKMLSAGFGASLAELVTFPLDLAKVRLQIQGEVESKTVNSTKRYSGLIGALRVIYVEEGLRGLYGGLSAGLQRQFSFASIRVGLYQPTKSMIANNSQLSDSHMIVRVLASAFTGAIAVSLAQPTEVVKIRMQAQGPRGRAMTRYSGSFAAYRHIAVNEGFRGLWKGVVPNITRNVLVNVSELVTYDVIKTFLLGQQILSDNIPCHIIAATGSGVVATLVCQPVDLVKTRFMNSEPGTYKGVLHCAWCVANHSKPLAFYDGFVAACIRMCCWNICMFVTFEQFQRGLGHASKVLKER